MKNKFPDDFIYPHIFGRKKPPVPEDDRKGSGMSLGELIKEEIGKITDLKS